MDLPLLKSYNIMKWVWKGGFMCKKKKTHTQALALNIITKYVEQREKHMCKY